MPAEPTPTKTATTCGSAEQRPTRERILDAALRLFADQGYEATSIGQIETAAGLAPRSGALYKHFPSKQALVDAALGERLSEIDRLGEQLATLELGDLQAELRLIAAVTLGELDRERDLSRLVMKEGDRFPELADAFYAAIVERGHRVAEDWLRRRIATLGRQIEDVESLAQVLIDALVGYGLQQHMLGERAVGVGAERVAAAWADLATDHLQPKGEPG